MTHAEFIHRFEPAPGEHSDGTLLLLHGTGGNENDLLPLGRAIAPRAALLSPRGQVLEHGMPRFFRRLAEGVFDHEDLVARTHQLADFVAAAATHYGFDPSRVTDPEIAGEGERERLVALAKRFSREDLLRSFDLLTRAIEIDILRCVN